MENIEFKISKKLAASSIYSYFSFHGNLEKRQERNILKCI